MAATTPQGDKAQAGSEFDVIAPKAVTISIAGEDVAISPIRVKQLPSFTRAVSPLISNIIQGDSPAVLVATNADDVIAAVSAASNLSVEAIGELEVDDLIKLAGAVIEVNLDFFIRRVLPQVNLVSERIEALTDGQTLLPA